LQSDCIQGAHLAKGAFAKDLFYPVAAVEDLADANDIVVLLYKGGQGCGWNHEQGEQLSFFPQAGVRFRD
jgi:hypothetical protein